MIVSSGVSSGMSERVNGLRNARPTSAAYVFAEAKCRVDRTNVRCDPGVFVAATPAGSPNSKARLRPVSTSINLPVLA